MAGKAAEEMIAGVPEEAETKAAEEKAAVEAIVEAVKKEAEEFAAAAPARVAERLAKVEGEDAEKAEWLGKVDDNEEDGYRSGWGGGDNLRSARSAEGASLRVLLA